MKKTLKPVRTKRKTETTMVEFKTLESEEISFGDDEFLQIARKKAVSEEGEEEFVSLSRGFFTEDGDRRFKSNFSVPGDKEVVDFILATLPAMAERD